MADPPKLSSSERRYPRISVPTPAEVRISKPGLTITGQLLDMSEGGIGIVTAGATLSVGEVVSVELLVDSQDKPPALKAIVCYTRGGRHGLQFLASQEINARSP